MGLALSLGVAGACAGLAWGQDVVVPPKPTRWVTDKAGLLSPATRERLDRELQAYERQSHHQVIVYIDRTTGGAPIEDFAVRAFAAWGIGRKGVDDGLVLFIFTEDRHLRIEVGYGLEGEVPDAIASRIIREVITPRLQAGDADGAVTSGVGAIIATLGGDPTQVGASADVLQSTSSPGRRARPAPTLGQKVLGLILVVGFLILLITNPRLAMWLMISFLSSGRGGGGGGGFGGGGFSGGGGRSGGGGASGSW